ncbi:MAG: nicotinate (nicotinamide) nucleotide adenylyltransferase [Candidatus Nitronauta litoralis]|uniref:Probable nicotinate-nucleotide adenylyltransferase n=1 Tax=Candidatus Nitronauta litoralis TaxID=2705533 RepID=A0A7T0G0Q4_9BACT|nr:MAG: nicotinate (nicotinamide) nucleotide adenylyltransferase [Candidatus Nitronauta litoralis]
MRRVALFGGSFDPIHMGHIAVAQEVLNQFKVDKVRFIPAFKSPNKSNESTTPSGHRVAMVKIAIEGDDRFELSDLELKRSGNSYTCQTLEELHREEPDTRWFWIMGLDTFLDLPGWKNFDQILDLADLIVAPRPGYKIDDLEDTLVNLKINSKHSAFPLIPEKGVNSITTGRSDHKIYFLSKPVVDLSSSNIRREFVQKPSIKKMLPPPVVQYIMDHQLYS